MATAAKDWQSLSVGLVEDEMTTPLAVAFVNLFAELNQNLGWTAQQVREEVFNFVKQGGCIEFEWTPNTADKYDVTQLPEATKVALIRYATARDLMDWSFGYEDTVVEECRQAAHALRHAAVGTTLEIPAKLEADAWDNPNPPEGYDEAQQALQILGHRVAATKASKVRYPETLQEATDVYVQRCIAAGDSPEVARQRSATLSEAAERVK